MPRRTLEDDEARQALTGQDRHSKKRHKRHGRKKRPREAAAVVPLAAMHADAPEEEDGDEREAERREEEIGGSGDATTDAHTENEEKQHSMNNASPTK